MRERSGAQGAEFAGTHSGTSAAPQPARRTAVTPAAGNRATRELFASAVSPEVAAWMRTPYSPGRQAVTYQSLPRTEREDINGEVDQRFAAATGVRRRLVASSDDRELVRVWLRLRDRVVEDQYGDLHGATGHAPTGWSAANVAMPSDEVSAYSQAKDTLSPDADQGSVQALLSDLQRELKRLDALRKATPTHVGAAQGTAEIGDIAPHRRQRRAIRGPSGIRLSEHEHIRARVNIMLQTLDPQTGTSPVSRSAYRQMVTLTIPEDMARIKTRFDMALRDQLRSAIRADSIGADLLRELDVEADIERTMRARNEAVRVRSQANMPVDDLLRVTDAKIIEAAHLQQSELFHRGRTQRSPIAGASDAEIDDALRYLNEGPNPVRAAPSSPGATPDVTGAARPAGAAPGSSALSPGTARGLLGRSLGPASAAVDVGSALHAVLDAQPDKRIGVAIEETGSVAGGGGGAWAGAKGGAAAGLVLGPKGAVAGAIIGGIAGGIAGGISGRRSARRLYEWVRG